MACVPNYLHQSDRAANALVPLDNGCLWSPGMAGSSARIRRAGIAGAGFTRHARPALGLAAHHRGEFRRGHVVDRQALLVEGLGHIGLAQDLAQRGGQAAERKFLRRLNANIYVGCSLVCLATDRKFNGYPRCIVVDLANGSQFAFPPAPAQGLRGAKTEDLKLRQLPTRPSTLFP